MESRALLFPNSLAQGTGKEGRGKDKEMNKEQIKGHLKAVKRTSLNDSVIYTHKDVKMKESYDFIYRLLKTIKSFPVKPDYTQDLEDYFKMIDSNKDFPLFLTKNSAARA